MAHYFSNKLQPSIAVSLVDAASGVAQREQVFPHCFHTVSVRFGAFRILRHWGQPGVWFSQIVAVRRDLVATILTFSRSGRGPPSRGNPDAACWLPHVDAGWLGAALWLPCRQLPCETCAILHFPSTGRGASCVSYDQSCFVNHATDGVVPLWG